LVTCRAADEILIDGIAVSDTGSSSRASTPALTAFAVSNDHDGFPLFHAVRHLSAGHAHGVWDPDWLAIAVARERRTTDSSDDRERVRLHTIAAMKSPHGLTCVHGVRDESRHDGYRSIPVITNNDPALRP
jgi:hypothetical protein